jgi:microcystin-dependent protein
VSTYLATGATPAGRVLTADGAGGSAWQAGGGGVTHEDVYPVGSVYLSVLATSPADLFGLGTWQRIGEGRALVGVDEGDPDFDTPEETGGAKTVTLATADMPAHAHVQNAHAHGLTDPGHTHVQNAHAHGLTDPGHTHLTQRYPTSTGGSSGFTIDTSMSGTLADNTLPVKAAATGLTVTDATPTEQAQTTGLDVDDATATEQDAGGGGAHENLQPYITVYVWKRTA